VGWAALSELVPYYPLYALLFLDTGLSAAQVSGLFAAWSVTAFVTEVPAGVLADRWSRRGAVVLAGVLQAVAFAVWTTAPAYGSFLVGFVIWGVSGALVSGASEALVHDGLAAVGAAHAYGRVNGWMTSAELLVQVPTAFAASALFALGGYAAVGWTSVAVCLAAAALALRFPEAPRVPDDDEPSIPLRQGVVEALRRSGLRLVVVAVALIGGLDAVEEYFPLLAAERGVPVAVVPVAVLGIALAGAAGAAVGGRLTARALPPLLAVALREKGAEVALEVDGALCVEGLDAESVGDVAFANDVPVHELAVVPTTLAEAYLALADETGGTTESSCTGTSVVKATSPTRSASSPSTRSAPSTSRATSAPCSRSAAARIGARGERTRMAAPAPSISATGTSASSRPRSRTSS